MKVLSIMFKEFDAYLLKFPTFAKIKFVGDCSMEAGGIFSEINQLSIHTREMVQFELDIIRIMANTTRACEKIQNKSWYKSGSPIVAGVLESSKPILEILCLVTNIAYQRSTMMFQCQLIFKDRHMSLFMMIILL